MPCVMRPSVVNGIDTSGVGRVASLTALSTVSSPEICLALSASDLALLASVSDLLASVVAVEAEAAAAYASELAELSYKSSRSLAPISSVFNKTN